MKISVFIPFGSQAQEAGLVYLLANYLKVSFPEVVQLRCNGVFSLCDRDAENSWNRGINSCFQCMSEQRALSDWGSIPVHSLSSFIQPEDISETKKWVLRIPAEDLATVKFLGHELFSLCRDSFLSRFRLAQPDPANKNHEQFTRKMLLSAARMCIATQRYQNRFSPDVTLIGGGQDFMSRAYVAQSKLMQRDVAVFRWEVAQRSIHIIHPRDRGVLACELVPEGILGMRSDIRTWPHELSSIMAEILRFLQIDEGQIKLPLAQ